MTAIEEAAKRLRFPDGGRARLLFGAPTPNEPPLPQGPPLPGARPPLVPGPRGEAVTKGGSRSAPTSPGPPSTTWSSPRAGTWSTTSPRTLGSTGPGCTVGRRPTGRSRPGRAGGALSPRVLSYKGGLRWTSL